MSATLSFKYYDGLLWSLMANDFKWSAEKVLHHLTKTVRGGDVVVFHDSQKAERVVLEVLTEFIKYCRGRGLRISDLGLRPRRGLRIAATKE